MPAEEDLYEILQVRPSAYPDVIEGAYKALSLLYHPDRNAAPEAAESLNKVNHAFAVLSDPIKRKQYDRRRSRRGLMKLLFGGGDGRSQVLRVSLRVAPIGLAAVVYIVFVRGQLGGGAANLGAPALDVLKDYSQSLAEFMPPTTQAGQGVVPASGAVDGQQSGDGAGADPEIDSAAIAELDEAVSRDPGDAAAYLNRGVAYSSLGGHQRAIEDFAEAIIPAWAGISAPSRTLPRPSGLSRSMLKRTMSGESPTPYWAGSRRLWRTKARLSLSTRLTALHTPTGRSLTLSWAGTTRPRETCSGPLSSALTPTC